MVLPKFLDQPRQHSLKILTWNINGAKTKLEKLAVLTWLCQYDIISLNEVKTDLSISLPGYVAFRKIKNDSLHRGGTIVFIRNCLSHYVSCVDVSVDDQVWLSLECVPKILFGFCYVPPTDSPYFSHFSFAAIHERVVQTSKSEVLIMGDLNARLGVSVRDILNSDDVFTYPSVPDNVTNPNNNAYILATICKDNELLVINNLKTDTKHFVSEKTYRKKDVWVSELDVVVASRQLVHDIDAFQVHQTTDLPSDHAPVTLEVRLPSVNIAALDTRVSMLGSYGSLTEWQGRGGRQRRPVGFRSLNTDLFINSIPDTEILYDLSDVNAFSNNITDTLYRCAEESRAVAARGRYDNNLDRWERLLRDNDDKRVWQAINWKGDLQTDVRSLEVPSDDEFKAFFEGELRPANINNVEVGFEDAGVNIPLLDDPITPQELEKQVTHLKPDKACGPDGIPPGVFKILPPIWLICITTLFNCIFSTGSYPDSWTKAKFFTIFKRGDRKDPGNYRGINVLNSIAKLYDMVLCCRLEQWFKPYREQAGAQKGRGCIEHILTLRLLTDYARKKKLKLFVTFVDFSKAYDMVPREILLRVLRRLGCGAVMLGAIAAMYRVTQSVLGTAVFATTMGVRQGSPTSCLLFILFVNDLIKLLKENCADDGFLSWLHILVLMDDTVLLATTRERMTHKLSLLKSFCDDYGMKVNELKTKFFVVGGSAEDMQPLRVAGLEVQHCRQYTYLGATFTADGSVHQAVRVHANTKAAHVAKFVSFIKKNNDVPFIIKKRVFDAALMSAVLYGCESWLNADLRPISKIYNWALKTMLDVRMTTCSDLCYIESGYPPVHCLIRKKQRTFLRRVWRERSQLIDDPLMLVLRTVMGAQYNTKHFIQDLLCSDVDDVEVGIQEIKQSVRDSTSSRRITYLEINPHLSLHAVYSMSERVAERDRVAFTRFRVSSHSLAVETGRWSRRGRGRLPLEERLCVCGQVQTEEHVVEHCRLTENLRVAHNFSRIQDLFSGTFSHVITCNIIRRILDIYS